MRLARCFGARRDGAISRVVSPNDARRQFWLSLSIALVFFTSFLFWAAPFASHLNDSPRSAQANTRRAQGARHEIRRGDLRGQRSQDAGVQAAYFAH